MFVLDASVLVKLFRAEPDSGVARDLISHSVDIDATLLAPSLALYEVLAIALHYEVPFQVSLELFEQLRKTGFRFVEPTAAELKGAETMATARIPALGYPSLEDSIYHAVAIHRGAQFVTADRKHLRKTEQFGHILLLEDWRPS